MKTPIEELLSKSFSKCLDGVYTIQLDKTQILEFLKKEKRVLEESWVDGSSLSGSFTFKEYFYNKFKK